MKHDSILLETDKGHQMTLREFLFSKPQPGDVPQITLEDAAVVLKLKVGETCPIDPMTITRIQ